MESLKKIIPLSKAAQISGYHQDYLSFLIRKGDMKGKKVGRSWFTTEQEVRQYLFKQKVRQNQSTMLDFFSPKRARNVVLVGLGIMILGCSLAIHIVDSKAAEETPIRLTYTKLTSDSEVLLEKKP